MPGLLSDVGGTSLPNGMIRPGTIDINKRRMVDNGDGTFSTISSASANFDGVEYLFPTIREDGYRMTRDEAISHFLKTKQHLGAFATPELATEYAKSLSKRQGDFYKPKGLLSP